MKARGKNQKQMRYDYKSKGKRDSVAGFENEKGLQTKECRQPSEAGKGKERILC